MKTIGSLIRGREVFFIEPSATVMETVQLLVEKKVGAVPVLENGRVVGIFSERDLLTRVVAKGLSPDTVKVADVMSRDIIVAQASDTIDECEQRMNQARIRHVPVVEGDRMIGFVSLRGLLQEEVSEKSEEIEYLNSYIHFQPPAPEAGEA